MTKSAMFMGILGFGIILHAGASFAQNTTPSASTSSTTNASSSKGSTGSQGAATSKGSAAGRKATTAAKKPASSSPIVLKNQKDKVSYALGMNMWANLNGLLHRDEIDIDPNIVLQGIKDSMAGSKLLLTEAEERAVLTELQKQVMAKQRDAMVKEDEKMKAAAEPNRKEGEAFLAANKTKEGVVTLPSGLQYKVLTEGNGPKPTVTDTVVCNYRGTLINGTEFDSSSKHGGPATFQLGRVIRGWTEALQSMPVGSKWQLFIPSDLAYGERGTPGGDIGPNATLIFEVELISIQGK
jgi:FKBP-type peptidyl-prolyl cis-trans isomerase